MKRLSKSVVFLGPPPEFLFFSHYRQTMPLLVIKSNSAMTVTGLNLSRNGVECFEDTSFWLRVVFNPITGFTYTIAPTS